MNNGDYICKGVSYMIISVMGISAILTLFLGIYSTFVYKSWALAVFGYMVFTISIGAILAIYIKQKQEDKGKEETLDREIQRNE